MSDDNATKNDEQKKEVKKGNNSRTILIVCISLIVILLIIIVVLIVSGMRKDKYEEVKEAVDRGVVVTEDNVNQVIEVLEEKEEKIKPGYFEVTMNGVWNFKDGSLPSDNAYVENSNANSNAVYFDVVRRDTGDVVYESPILPVGTGLNSDSIVLMDDLDAGTYECVCVYHLLDEDNVPISETKIVVTLVVEN